MARNERSTRLAAIARGVCGRAEGTATHVRTAVSYPHGAHPTHEGRRARARQDIVITSAADGFVGKAFVGALGRASLLYSGNSGIASKFAFLPGSADVFLATFAGAYRRVTRVPTGTPACP